MNPPSKTHWFWSRVDIRGDDECWPWTGKVDQHGYGYDKRERTHRIAWEVSMRESLRPGDVVRHECDNPACCNPEHLTRGTQVQNVDDRVQRDRSAKGTGNGRAVLTEQQVLSIYHSPSKRQDVAKQYGVSIHTVVDIRTGRTWGWLTGRVNSRDGIAREPEACTR